MNGRFAINSSYNYFQKPRILAHPNFNLSLIKMINKNLDPYVLGTVCLALLIVMFNNITIGSSLSVVFALWIIGAISMAQGKRLVYFWWALLLGFILFCLFLLCALILWN